MLRKTTTITVKIIELYVKSDIENSVLVGFPLPLILRTHHEYLLEQLLFLSTITSMYASSLVANKLPSRIWILYSIITIASDMVKQKT